MEIELLNPKSDYIFKRIFGDERNVDILKDFLQAVLDIPEEEYEEIEIIDPHTEMNAEDDKEGILDIKLRTKTKKVIDIEMQILNKRYMKERITYYMSKMITEQIKRGDEYGRIKKVISIVITDYEMMPETKLYHTRYMLHDKEAKIDFTENIEINLIELPKMPQKKENTKIWRWMKFLNTKKEEEFYMVGEESEPIKKAVAVLKELSEDERTRMIEEAREKKRRDDVAREEYVLEEGMKKGIEKGIEQGKREEVIRLAKRALEKGLSIEDVMELTDLSREDIEALNK